MTNLLSAQFSRLFKSKIFYLSLIFFIGLAMFLVLPGYIDHFIHFDLYSQDFDFWRFSSLMGPLRFGPADPEWILSYDSDFFDSLYNTRLYADYCMKAGYTPYIAVIAVLASLLIGGEFDNNTIRNKLIAGYSRAAVYISNLIVCITAGIIMQIVYMTAALIPLLILYIKYKAADCSVFLFEFTFKENAVFQLTGLAIIVVYSSVFLFFTMISASRSRAVLVSLIAAAALIIFGKSVEQTLYPEEYYETFLDNYFSDDFIDEKEELREKKS